MTAKEIVSISFIMNSISVLIMLGLFISVVLKKEKKNKKDRIFLAVTVSVLIYALLDTAVSIPDFTTGSIQLTIQTERLIGFIPHFACFLMALYMRPDGEDNRGLKPSRLITVPVIADFVLTATLIVIYSDRSFISAAGSGVITAINILSYAIAYYYVGICLFEVWKTDRVLFLLPTFFACLAVYFTIFMGGPLSKALLMSGAVVYIYVSRKFRSLIIRIGGIVLVMFIFITLVMGNEITSAAFTSYLVTLHDRNDEHLRETEDYIESFAALPWLVDYWEDNPEKIKERLLADTKIPSEQELFKIGVDEAEEMSKEEQLDFAAACYKSIDGFFVWQFELHDLDDLFLIIPYDEYDGTVLFDAKRSPDGSVKLGSDFDVFEESFEWSNYARETEGRMHWTWGTYKESDDFGFYRQMPPSRRGRVARLCTSLKRSDIYEHMDFISTFRLTAMTYLILVAVAVLIILYRMILRPLLLMRETMRRYHHDKDPDKVSSDMERITQKDEIGSFASEFSLLTGEMRRYTQEVALLATDKERVASELRMAADIQNKALPSKFPAFIDKPEFDIYASMNPAKEVGGDFYDFFLTDEKHLAFLIADVSDKGIPAALFMMSVKNLIDYRAQKGGTPADILTSVNDQICRNNESKMFATVWMGILDLDTGIVICANAGHERPAISNSNEEFELIEKDKHGPAVGMIPGAKYSDYEIRLHHKGYIFLYTDGVIEAKDPKGEFYGADNMLLNLSDPEDASPKWIIDTLYDSIDSYVQDAKRFDDMTMLCLKYLGEEESTQ